MSAAGRLSCILFVVALWLSPSAWGAGPNTLTPEEIRDGWLLLFDGETLFGWEAAS